MILIILTSIFNSSYLSIISGCGESVGGCGESVGGCGLWSLLEVVLYSFSSLAPELLVAGRS